jgi:hypothetical protein
MTDTTVDTITRDNLIVIAPKHTKQVTIADGETLARGAVLGKVTLGTITAAALVTGGSGEETIGSLALQAAPTAKVGAYRATCITAGATGQFQVTDPNGTIVGIATVGTAFVGGGIGFTITDAGGDPEVGDYFVITVAAGSGSHVACDIAGVNGEQDPDCVISEAVTTSGATQVSIGYTDGTFQSTGLTFGGSTVYTDVLEKMRDLGMHIVVTNASANLGG